MAHHIRSKQQQKDGLLNSQQLINQRQENLNNIKLQLLKQDLTEAGITRSQVLSNISHEIKTPLSSIINAADLLKQKATDSESEELAHTIHKSGHYLSVILNNVLDFYKSAFFGISLDHHLFDVYALLDEVQNLFYGFAEEKGLTLKFNITPDLSRYWTGDAHRLKQMLFNLMDNAIKFTDAGEIRLDVNGGIDIKNNTVLVFQISDSGKGIDPAMKEHLWDFFASDEVSHTRNTQGLGMGLALTKNLSIMMGGDLLLKDTGTSGTTFEMIIPMKEEAAPGAKSMSEIYPHILLVEDNQVNQKLTKNMLEKQGFYVEIANNGKEAVELFNAAEYDLILMDIQMPVKNGIDASREIRKLEKQLQVTTPVKIIALTANAQKQDKEECLDVGMNDYIRKPIDFKEFALVLAKL